MERLIAVVTGGGSNSQSDEVSATSVLCHFGEHSDDNIGPGNERWSFSSSRAAQRWHHHGFGFAVNDCLHLDSLHNGTERDFSNGRALIGLAAKRLSKIY